MSEMTQKMFGIHASALVLRQERLQTIASNIANADTPGYHARDIDFSAALKAATGGPPAEGMQRTRAMHLDGLPELAQNHRVWRVPTQPSLDGNTVDAHQEHAAYGRAALEYRASLSFLEGRIRGLLTAITGQ